MFTRAAIRNQPRSPSPQQLRHKPSQLRWSQEVRIVYDLCVKRMVSPSVNRVRNWFVTRNKLDAPQRIRSHVVSCRRKCEEPHSCAMVPHSNTHVCVCVCVLKTVNWYPTTALQCARTTNITVDRLFSLNVMLCHKDGNDHSSGRRAFSTHWNTPSTRCCRLDWRFPVV